MRPELRKVASGVTESFSVRRDFVPDINNRWHYHNVIELIYFKQGSGTHFIGDNIRRFNSGDIVLIGSNVPHFTRFDKHYFSECRPEILVSHFKEDFWGATFLSLPENLPLKSLLERSRRGVLLTKAERPEIAALIEMMLDSKPQEKLILLLQVLYAIAGTGELKHLVSIGYSNSFNESEQHRMTDIYDFSLNNFHRKIYLEEIADVAKLSPNSFCRYFKSRMRKTYSDFLMEIKVGHACKLLIENNLNLKQICYDSGFNNTVTFHRYFKKYTGVSPSRYQKEFGLSTFRKEKVYREA